jgi:hypothetical protein
MRRRDLIAGAVATLIARTGRAEPRHVVLELFTSQGCSSCPPADALLGQLARRPEVIALAWHVDYWDRLGWRDPFASRAATARQQAYARQIGADVFTPALVVDGSAVVIGSQSAAVERALVGATALPVGVTVRAQGEALALEIGPAAGPVRVQRITYDPEHATDVVAGENGGTRLREFRIVREFETLTDQNPAPGLLTTKPPTPGQGLVILVQSMDLHIVGAAHLPPV